jgi:glucose dehydrogenase
MTGSPTIVRTDICVVGTGAGGGILAYRLALSGRDVLSLEQGGPITSDYFTNELNPEDETNLGIAAEMPWDMNPAQSFYFSNAQAHALYAREDELSTSAAAKQSFINMQIFRMNGKMNLWSAVSLRYSPRDFRGKDHGDSDFNWPIDYEVLAPHYGAVERLIGVCGTREGLAELPDGDFLPPFPLRPADRLLQHAVSRFKKPTIRAIPMRKAVETRPDRINRCRSCGDCIFGCAAGSVYKFSTHLLPQIANRSNYRLLYGIKVLRLIRDPRSNRIEAAKCLDTATGQIVRVEANLFVLSCGAMETPRVLFNSRDDDFPNGLANSSGLLGCFLQDTVKVILGTSLWKLVGSKIKYDQGTNDAMLIPRFLFGGEEFRGGYQGQFSHFLPKRPYYLDALGPLPAWIKPFTARLLFKSYVALLFFGKPEALKSNRLLAGQACDKYGIPQVDVQYTPTRNDLLMKQSMMEWGRRILRRCSGTSITTFTEPTPGRSIHYAGTCRMAANRADGVVDANLRSFDHPNLYVCDGSVLPEVSEKNLTLTIMALAERLSQNLKT